MKLISTFLVAILFTFISCIEVKAQSVEDSVEISEETFLVTFECESCTKRNKFSISGPEDHTFKEVKIPLKKELKPGEYKMTYWQNRVQQIHLPFTVSTDSENIIIVKE